MHDAAPKTSVVKSLLLHFSGIHSPLDKGEPLVFAPVTL